MGKMPAFRTLRNPLSTVKESNFSNLTSVMKTLNTPGCKTARARQGFVEAQVETALLAPSPYTGYNSPMPPVSQAIRVKVLFFGRLKELTGRAEDTAEFGDAATIEQLFGLYAARHPELAKYRSSVVASRNQEFAAWGTPLRSGDEVAFLPPVSGG
jgi:sulfur-carrier protein